ncbi:B-cell receptor CD22-like [Micropterus dolomieu]|uniref:B-cell receptor CD22-like n=1 Tax=Micropterus dolomieu TaxID=147949 RepID=UPI001E8DF0C1|nr:B-cell receptor CD22-like [Micropterus dolomieu]
MSLTAAASGFVVFLLSVQVIQAQNGWGVTYTSTQICALKGSTVEINCTYTYPSRINGRDTTVEKTFWFTKLLNKEPVDLRTDSEYAGRLQYICSNNICTLRITDLRESDSAQYKFRFITNQPGGSYTGSPGVTLSVTDLQVQVIRSTVYKNYTEAELLCHSSCRLPDRSSYVWFKNGQKMERVETSSYKDQFYHGDIISCAVKGHEDFCSPSVYAPKLPSVSVSPSAEIVEGSSVTLTCSSDANPAAKYTWYKENQTLLSEEPQLVFSSIQSSDSGEYYCAAENQLGRRTTKYIINVKYAPKLPSVSVSPSAEIVEGSSVTLTCSSDANPAAKYTWYKENEDSPKASGQNFTITDFRAEHSGNYYCEAQNRRGRHNSTLHLIVVAGSLKFPVVLSVIAVVLVFILLLSVFIWIRKSSLQKQPEADETPHNRAEQTDETQDATIRFVRNQAEALYSNYSPAQPLRNEEEVVYAAPNFNSAADAPKLPSVSVSPSAEIVEGSSVTLTCSSDANPAANYTWYKENQTPLQELQGIYHFNSISSEDRGIYHCKSENQYGQINSTSLFVDVHYAPKLPSVSVSPSAEIVEGSSVTLTCSSDANPAANYTWYKENQTLIQGPEGVYNFTSISSKDSGIYHCKSENEYGQINFTSVSIDVQCVTSFPAPTSDFRGKWNGP